ncbi:hypothetical protein EMIT079MI2_190064 [Bacillus sp. IT-79MI2]
MQHPRYSLYIQYACTFSILSGYKKYEKVLFFKEYLRLYMYNKNRYED